MHVTLIHHVVWWHSTVYVSYHVHRILSYIIHSEKHDSFHDGCLSILPSMNYIFLKTCLLRQTLEDTNICEHSRIHSGDLKVIYLTTIFSFHLHVKLDNEDNTESMHNLTLHALWPHDLIYVG